MIILLFSFCFVILLLFTGSYRFLDKFYPTALFVSAISLLYVLLSRGYLLWDFKQWSFMTSKISELIQFVVLFPSTTVLFLRYFPVKRTAKVLYFLGFFGVFVLLELFLKLRGEITYHHGWSFGWSVFIDFCLFALAWTHAKNWKLAWFESACITVFLMAWFHVPLYG